MKKVIIIVTVLLLCGCTKKYEEINYKKMYNKMNSYETYIVYLCNQTDECKVYDEKINKIINETKKEIYYLDTSKLEENEKILIESMYFEGNKLTIPSILKIEKGIIKDKQIGKKEYEEIKEFIKEA